MMPAFGDGFLTALIALAGLFAVVLAFMAVSMVSGDDALAVKLRQRGVEDVEDLKALESGAADALRYWMDVRTNRLADVTAQFGFDRRPSYTDGNRPRASGLLAHFGGEAGDVEREEIAAARALGERILAVCASCVPEASSRTIPRSLPTAIWRSGWTTSTPGAPC